MSYVLDPGALLAASQLSPGHALGAMPNAPVIPNPLPGARRVRRSRTALAARLESLAEKVRPYEPAPVCRPVVPECAAAR
jgi:hypothetical protein